MHCPSCSSANTRVIDSRHHQEGNIVRRRRKCDVCENRFTTYEKLEVQLPIIVKNDGRREVFNKEKVMTGLEKACQKRPISTEQIENIIDSLIQAITQNAQRETSTKDIGAYLASKIKCLDPVAFVRFASFYWDYNDVDDFVSSLTKMNNPLNTREENEHSRQ